MGYLDYEKESSIPGFKNRLKSIAWQLPCILERIPELILHISNPEKSKIGLKYIWWLAGPE